jgi:hypothetical protein
MQYSRLPASHSTQVQSYMPILSCGWAMFEYNKARLQYLIHCEWFHSLSYTWRVLGLYSCLVRLIELSCPMLGCILKPAVLRIKKPDDENALIIQIW